jgi:CheY-like chemotaxis protein
LAQELEWLKDSVPAQSVSFVDILNETIEILSPLMQDTGITTHIDIEDDAPEIYVKTPLVRQALLNILNTAVIHCQMDNPVEITAVSKEKQLDIHIKALCSVNAVKIPPSDYADSINMAQRLIELCQGQLTLANGLEAGIFTQDNMFDLRIMLPASESVVVLVIDDNADVLQLFERYLVGSRYRFRGTQNPQEGLQIAGDMQPGVVLLDVMMPGQDGWSLLAQLREHPKTQDIPIIVCSILSQEQFALALGAANFLRKPVNRQTFLEMLDRQLAPSLTESG